MPEFDEVKKNVEKLQQAYQQTQALQQKNKIAQQLDQVLKKSGLNDKQKDELRANFQKTMDNFPPPPSPKPPIKPSPP